MQPALPVLPHRRRRGRPPGAAPAERRLPCYECPTTIFYERWRAHRAVGGTLDIFEPGMPLNVNGTWNYFWARGQRSAPPTS